MGKASEQAAGLHILESDLLTKNREWAVYSVRPGPSWASNHISLPPQVKHGDAAPRHPQTLGLRRAGIAASISATLRLRKCQKWINPLKRLLVVGIS